MDKVYLDTKRASFWHDVSIAWMEEVEENALLMSPSSTQAQRWLSAASVNGVDPQLLKEWLQAMISAVYLTATPIKYIELLRARLGNDHADRLNRHMNHMRRYFDIV